MDSPIRFRFKIAISACYHNSRNTLECWRNALKRSVEGGGGVGAAETRPDEAGKNITNASAKQRKFFFATDSAEKNTYLFFSVLQFQFLAGIFFIHQHEVIRVRIVRHRRSLVVLLIMSLLLLCRKYCRYEIVYCCFYFCSC